MTFATTGPWVHNLKRIVALQQLPLLKHRRFVSLVAVLFCFLLTSCSGRKTFQFKEAVDYLEEQSDKISTVSGRAWVSIRSPSGNASFSGVIVLDRTNIKNTRMRIEALDPFGTLHHLLIFSNKKLRWIDYDSSAYRVASEKWQGIPIQLMPHFFLGVLPMKKLKQLDLGEVSLEGGNLGEIELFNARFANFGSFSFFMNWLTPGPRLVLSKIESSIMERDQVRPLVANYQNHSDRKNFFTPQSFTLTVGDDVEINLSWRERSWNEVVEENLFKVDEKTLKGFVRENMR